MKSIKPILESCTCNSNSRNKQPARPQRAGRATVTEKLWKVEDVAEYYGVSTRTIERWRKSGLIAPPAIETKRVVRWNSADLLVYHGKPAAKV